MIWKRPTPGEIFTPRNPNVNRDMYVSRSDLEKKLRRAVNGTQHIIVFGDSGSGKTWLYKEYFSKNSIPFTTVDLSIAITEGLSSALLKALPETDWRPVRKTVEGDASADIYVIKIGGSGSVEYEKSELRPLDVLLNELARKSGNTRFIVFDNFEQVSVKPELLRDISSLIIRLDNSEFARFGVRFLIVGVISDMKALIAHYDKAGTIANRVTEIPEVERLTRGEGESLIRRGLFEKLKVKILCDERELIDRVLFVTDRNAQQLHELCYQIGCEAEENEWRIDDDQMKRAEKDWVDTSLSHFTAQVESRMNERDTKIQRRNQVLFCIGTTGKVNIRATDIDAMIRESFPTTVSVKQLGVAQILAGLSEGSNPILVRNPNESSYRISHPKIRLALRVRLEHLAPDNSDSQFIKEMVDKILSEGDHGL